MTSQWDNSVLVVWKSGRREWLHLRDIDRLSRYYKDIREGYIVAVEEFDTVPRTGVLPRIDS